MSESFATFAVGADGAGWGTALKEMVEEEADAEVEEADETAAADDERT